MRLTFFRLARLSRSVSNRIVTENGFDALNFKNVHNITLIWNSNHAGSEVTLATNKNETEGIVFYYGYTEQEAKKLTLQHLSKRGIKEVVSAIPKVSPVQQTKKLYFKDNYLFEGDTICRDIDKICSVLESGTCPAGFNVNLFAYRFKDYDEFRNLIDALANGPENMIVNLTCSYIGDEAVKYIARSLVDDKYPKGLQLLLGDNGITDEGVMALAEVIRLCESPENLCVCLGSGFNLDNIITEKGIKALHRALLINPSAKIKGLPKLDALLASPMAAPVRAPNEQARFVGERGVISTSGAGIADVLYGNTQGKAYIDSYYRSLDQQELDDLAVAISLSMLPQNNPSYVSPFSSDPAFFQPPQLKNNAQRDRRSFIEQSGMYVYKDDKYHLNLDVTVNPESISLLIHDQNSGGQITTNLTENSSVLYQDLVFERTNRGDLVLFHKSLVEKSTPEENSNVQILRK